MGKVGRVRPPRWRGRRAARASRATSQSSATPARSRRWWASPTASSSTVDEVEGGGAGHHEGEGGGHRQQAPRPGWLPRGDEEPDGEGHVEGAELPGDVHGRAGVLAEDQGRHRQHELGEGDGEQRPAGAADRLAAEQRRRHGAGRAGT